VTTLRNTRELLLALWVSLAGQVLYRAIKTSVQDSTGAHRCSCPILVDARWAAITQFAIGVDTCEFGMVGCMEFTDTQSSPALTADQIERLLAVIIDEFGSGVTQSHFNDAVLRLFEDIAGFETMPLRDVEAILRTMWGEYWRCGGCLVGWFLERDIIVETPVMLLPSDQKLLFVLVDPTPADTRYSCNVHRITVTIRFAERFY
jgi:hypothetical protein